MSKTNIIFTVAILAGLIAVPALAGHLSPADLNTPGTSRTLVLPPEAENATVISLGILVDPQSGKQVEGFAFITPKKGYHHRPGHSGGPGGNGGGDNQCFAYISKDAKWKTVESWVMNSTNDRELDGSSLLTIMTEAITEWEDAADGAVDGNQGADILGAGSTTASILDAGGDLNGVNEVMFADISSSGAIAVTVVWGRFSGPPFAREIVEWDMIFDDTDFNWSLTGEADKMDFENIAQHELGHAIGLGHPDDSCAEETMYRFASEGETKKRDLNVGDIAGANGLY